MSRPAFSLTDAGRFENEKLDCTVRALSIACGIPYDQAHAIMKSLGRRNRCRFNFTRFGADAIKLTGRRRTPLVFAGTLSGLIEEFPAETLLVHVRRHVLAVHFGTVYDTTIPTGRENVQQAWIIHRSLGCWSPPDCPMRLS